LLLLSCIYLSSQRRIDGNQGKELYMHGAEPWLAFVHLQTTAMHKVVLTSCRKSYFLQHTMAGARTPKKNTVVRTCNCAQNERVQQTLFFLQHTMAGVRTPQKQDSANMQLCAK